MTTRRWGKQHVTPPPPAALMTWVGLLFYHPFRERKVSPKLFFWWNSLNAWDHGHLHIRSQMMSVPERLFVQAFGCLNSEVFDAGRDPVCPSKTPFLGRFFVPDLCLKSRPKSWAPFSSIWQYGLWPYPFMQNPEGWRINTGDYTEVFCTPPNCSIAIASVSHPRPQSTITCIVTWKVLVHCSC